MYPEVIVMGNPDALGCQVLSGKKARGNGGYPPHPGDLQIRGKTRKFGNFA
jgi:hypothetical protein